jgi:hypothetical protein
MAPATTSRSIRRGASVDLCFDDDGVSRLHAHLKHEAGAFVLVDARSANGTFIVDGEDRDGDDVGSDAGRRALCSRARLVLPGEPFSLGAGDVVFFGDAFAALEALANHAATPSSTTPGDVTSEAGRRFAQALPRAARALGPVLLIGPSGSGKNGRRAASTTTAGARGGSSRSTPPRYLKTRCSCAACCSASFSSSTLWRGSTACPSGRRSTNSHGLNRTRRAIHFDTTPVARRPGCSMVCGSNPMARR